MNRMRFLSSWRVVGSALSLALACGTAAAQTADPSVLLANIARTLSEARSDPAKAKSATCPNANSLVGQPIGRVLIELGQPEGPGDSKDGTLTYAFGRVLQLTFRFDQQGAIKSVECRKGQ
jgi:hypothetical protein